MKDKDLPNDYESSSLEELTLEANKLIEDLESQKDLQNSIEKYQNLIKLNNIIEKKFKKKILFEKPISQNLVSSKKIVQSFKRRKIKSDINLTFLNHELFQKTEDIDKIIKPDYIMKVVGKGMPLLTDNGILYGDLLINFNIVFPHRLTSDKRKILKKIFNVEDKYSDREAEDIEYYKTLEELNLEGQDEGQHGVQCAQQ